jgi:hypothetical protein
LARSKDYQADHHDLQRLLARELQEYGPQPLSPDDADMVAWHLADVTLAVVIRAVERTRAEATRRR